jgi:hypothetical protein
MHHNDDLVLEFEEGAHKYTCNSKVFHSVTETIEQYFERFNSDFVIERMMSSKNWNQSEYYGMSPQEIKDLWKERANLGTRMHTGIETMIKHCCIESEFGPRLDKAKLEEVSKAIATNPEVASSVIKEWTLTLKQTQELQQEFFYFADFAQKETLEEFCMPEFRMFSTDMQIAGTIDLCMYNKEGEVSIYDWKRVGTLRLNNHWQKGKGIFGDRDDCNYEHYKLQLNLYRHLLENNYVFGSANIVPKVKTMKLFIFHPNNEGYYAQNIPRDDKASLITHR